MMDTALTQTTWTTRMRRHIVGKILSGLLALVPFVVTVVVLRLAYRAVAAVVAPVTRLLAPSGVPEQLVIFLSVLVLLVVLYLVGSLMGQSLVKGTLARAEKVFMRIPLLRTVYVSTKSTLGTLSRSKGAPLRSVVLVQFPRPGFWSIAFVTGPTVAPDGTEFVKLFIPTAPNPTSGFFEITRKTDVVETDLSIEQGIEAVVSAGTLFPGRLPVSLPSDLESMAQDGPGKAPSDPEPSGAAPLGTDPSPV